jgi:hypothetical protein
VAELAVGGGRLWAALYAGRAVARVDPRAMRLVGTPTALAGLPSAIAADRDGAWVGLAPAVPGGQGSLVRVDGRTGRTLRSVALTGEADRLVSAYGGLWALMREPPRLVRLDPTTAAVVRVWMLPGSSVGDLAAGSGRLWATVSDPGWLMRVDARSGSKAGTPLGRHPAGVAVRGRSVWVAQYGSSTVTLLDSRTLRRRGPDTRVRLNPYRIAADAGGAWVVCAGDGRLVRISTL